MTISGTQLLLAFTPPAGALGKTYNLAFNEQDPAVSAAYDQDDSYVGDGTIAGDNYGTATYMYVKNQGTGYTRWGLIKWNLDTFSGKIAKATVTLVPVAGTGAGVTHTAYLVTDDSWTQTGVTWNNKPSIGSSFVSWTVPAIGTPVSFDVTAQVQAAQANGTDLFSIAIENNTNDGTYVEYGSRENTTTAYQPVLTLSR